MYTEENKSTITLENMKKSINIYVITLNNENTDSTLLYSLHQSLYKSCSCQTAAHHKKNKLVQNC